MAPAASTVSAGVQVPPVAPVLSVRVHSGTGRPPPAAVAVTVTVPAGVPEKAGATLVVIRAACSAP